MLNRSHGSASARAVLFLVPLLTLIATPAFPQCELPALDPEGLETNDRFGFRTEIHGSVAVVAALHTSTKEDGYVVVYRHDGVQWNEEQTLAGSDANFGDWLGFTVDVKDDVIAIGAIRHGEAGTWAGAVYMYRFDGTSWVEEQKLLPSQLPQNAHFGAVALDGNTLAVGAHGYENHPGLVYIFEYDGSQWVEQQVLEPSSPSGLDVFGYSVAIDGDVLVAGDYGDAHAGAHTGSAYVFRFDGENWVEEQKLTASDAAANSLYGLEVSVQGDTALVGAPDAAGTGQAYLYEFDGTDWIEQPILVGGDSALDDAFGYFVAIDGELIVVGAPAGDGATVDSGNGYVFENIGGAWVETAEIYRSAGQPGDEFSTSLHEGRVVAGSHGSDLSAPDGGSASVFVIDGPDCDGNGILDVCELVVGDSFDCNLNGIPDNCEIDGGTSSDCNGNGVPDECDIASGVSADFNENGIPDECEELFVRGNCNGIGTVDLADAVFGLNVLFVPGTGTPPCADACDVSDDGVLGIADMVSLLSALFLPGSSLPPEPFPVCGVDPTEDGLACESSEICP